MPKISMVMSTYNDAPYLRQCIDSILSQTFTAFEFIIINDASADETAEVLATYDDSRLIIHHNQENRGLAASLNIGLELAQGDYIGRIDGDDIAIPNTRLSDQFALMENNQSLGFLSGDMVSISPSGDPLFDNKSAYPHEGSHDYLRWRLLWGNPISHITVLLRRSVLDKHRLRYDEAFNNAEDYELWSQLAKKTQLYRSSAVWAKRRVLSSSVSATNLSNQLRLTGRIMKRELDALFSEEIDLNSAESLVRLLHTEQDTDLNIAISTDIILQAYREIMSTSLKERDQERMRGDVVGWLLKFSQRASTPRDAFYPLAQLRHVSANEFYSRNTLRYALRGMKHAF